MKPEAMLWNHVPPAPRQPKPGLAVWSVWKGDKQVRAELRGHGEYGWECVFFDDGSASFDGRILWTVISCLATGP